MEHDPSPIGPRCSSGWWRRGAPRPGAARRADLDVKTSAINEYIKATNTARIATLIPKAAPYPKAEEFQLSPLALGVVKYFYLSLPFLLSRFLSISATRSD
jgi:hypothetical protein